MRQYGTITGTTALRIGIKIEMKGSCFKWIYEFITLTKKMFLKINPFIQINRVDYMLPAFCTRYPSFEWHRHGTNRFTLKSSKSKNVTRWNVGRELRNVFFP